MVKEGYYSVCPRSFSAASFSPSTGGSLRESLSHWRFSVFLFFRRPDRAIPPDPDAVVSPAMAAVVVITPEENAGRPGTRISGLPGYLERPR